MLTKLIQTKDYLLLIDEEAEIKEEDYQLVPMTEKIEIANSANIHLSYMCYKIIAYYPLNSEAKELDLPLLPVTPKDKWGVHEAHCCEKHGCKYGDNDCCVAIGIAKAKYPCEYCDDDENDKQFSLEDVEDILIKYLEEGFISKEQGYINPKTFLQSLSTQQLPKEFIHEYRYYYHSSKEFYSDAGFVECSKEQYESIKVEIPTCPLKAELKTITNSEGKDELVGTYKY